MMSAHLSLVDRGFRLQLRVIGALLLREIMAKFGRENLGFFWVMGEPLILTLGVMVMWTIFGYGHGHGVSIVPFVLTGYTLLTLWRHVVGKSLHCFRRQANLLFHRNIAPIDIYIAMVVLEILGGGIAFYVAYLPLQLFGFLDPIDDYLILTGAWLLMGWFCFGVGLVLAAISEWADIVEHFVQPVLYLTLPISGMFYMVDWLPEKYRELAGYSVLVDLFEMFRCGLMGDTIRTYWSVSYIVLWCVGLTAVGLFLARITRAKIKFE
jgi:capsular polysaccharide transport system permease protein